MADVQQHNAEARIRSNPRVEAALHRVRTAEAHRVDVGEHLAVARSQLDAHTKDLEAATREVGRSLRELRAALDVAAVHVARGSIGTPDAVDILRAIEDGTEAFETRHVVAVRDWLLHKAGVQ